MDRLVTQANRITCAHDCITFAILVNQRATDNLRPGETDTEECRRALRLANVGLNRYLTEIQEELEE